MLNCQINYTFCIAFRFADIIFVSKSSGMESKDIVIIVFVFAALGFSFYRKYVKKNQSGRPDKKDIKPGSSFSSVRDDDYEPYSKK